MKRAKIPPATEVAWWGHLEWWTEDIAFRNNYKTIWTDYRLMIRNQITDDLRKVKPRRKPKAERIPYRILTAERLNRMNTKGKAFKFRNK